MNNYAPKDGHSPSTFDSYKDMERNSVSEHSESILDSVEEALADIRAGKPVIVIDSEDRENEGDLIFPAQIASPDILAFTIRYSSGYICVAMSNARADRLGLPPMVVENQDERKTAYTITTDAASGVTTGISAQDRATTIGILGSDDSSASDLIRPGHVVPLRAREGGVFVRQGHTEAAVDLSVAAGFTPVGAICEIVSEQDPTSMARVPELREMANSHGLKLISIQQILEWRLRNEPQVVRVSQAQLPTNHGVFTIVCYKERYTGVEHIALVKGDIDSIPSHEVLVRVHSECLTGEAFGSHRCDCGPQLDMAMAEIDSAGSGVILYLRGQEGRGIGLSEKIKAYALQDNGVDTVQANVDLGHPIDARTYDSAAWMLKDLGITDVKLMSNNPEKIAALQEHGITVEENIPSKVEVFPESAEYLSTKKNKLGHTITWL